MNGFFYKNIALTKYLVYNTHIIQKEKEKSRWEILD